MKRFLAIAFLALAFFSARPASAQMGAGGGLALGTEIKRPGLHGDFYVGMPNLTPGLSFGGDLTLFWPNQKEETAFGATIKSSTFLLSVNANAQYVFYETTLGTSSGGKKGRRARRARAPTVATGPQLALYGVGGLNLSYVRSSFESTVPGASTSTSDSELKPGLNLGVGAEYDLPFARLFGEITYVISDFDQAVFVVGLRFDLGGPAVLES